MMRALNLNMKVSCRREEVLERLKANRQRHVELVKEAREGFRLKGIEVLEARLAQLKAGKVVSLTISLPLPQDYTSAYDTVIEMLELHQAAEISLTASEFRALVQDEWDWRTTFVSSNALYSTSTQALAGGNDDDSD